MSFSPSVHQWWASLKKRTNVLWALAIALIALGFIPLIIGSWKSGGWLQVVGGVVFGSGLTVLVSTVTGQEAVHQQYAKDENHRRKTEVYGPLHTELKKLRERLEKARNGAGSYPLWIAVGNQAPPHPSLSLSSDLLTLRQWPEFEADYRSIDDFKEPARKLLQATHQLAASYNAAVDFTRQPTSDILKTHIEAAIEDIVTCSDFSEWQRKHATESDQGSGEAIASPDWFEDVKSTALTVPSLAQIWSTAWINQWPTQPPATLGWLLAGSPHQAAQSIRLGYIPGLSSSPPPLQWFVAIMEAAWPELEHHPTYREVWAAQERLFELLCQAEAALANGLRYIQERFEGGTPPV